VSTVDFPELEQQILEFWKREKCFEKLQEKNRGKPAWSFLDGPITANNPMGVHHAWGRTYKDLFQRYHAMIGHELRHQNGFDCQGLWVEVEVEKELGFKSKRDIEGYGIDKFVEKCKERVLKFARIQTDQSIRLGYWMDWDNSYFTMSEENNYTIWSFLKKCHDRGFLYHGDDAMPWCPRCGTGISQHEISSEERPALTHLSPTVRLPIRPTGDGAGGRENEYLLIWTTTPWTLTSNVAAAVHPELTYVKYRQGDGVYYVIKERLEAVSAGLGEVEVLEEMPGEALGDLTYDGPFDELEAQEGVGHRVIFWKDISADEGTGIVHIAPGCGKEDYDLGKEFDLAVVAPINENGILKEGFGPFTGQHASEVAPAIIEALEKKGRLYRAEDYTHNYPICWRCKTPLLFRLVDEWYISMDELRHEIIAVTENTDWIPAVGRQLEIEWLNNMHDWMISKKRYWGLALPIYKCEECDSFEVIGGREELEERAVEGWEEFDGNTPHRPWVDAVKIACSGCGQHLSRIPDVGNPWLDAGITPYSTMQYNTDREYWERWFPADWISESFPGQFRNWFYAILAMSTVMENKPPFKLMFGYKLMKDEHGEEMHKSKGNAIEFNEAAAKQGADAMRWLYASTNPDRDLWFGWEPIRHARREFLVLWNVYQFYLTYARIDGFDPTQVDIPAAERSDLDRWILSRLAKLVESAHRNYSGFSVHLFMRDVLGFIDNLSRWYLRRSRRRIWKNDDDADKEAAYLTLYECLSTAIQLLAPVIPFTTEAMYQELVRPYDEGAPVSVHLTDFPANDALEADEELLEGMDGVLAIVEQGHAARNKAGIKVRQPLAEMRVASSAKGMAERLRRFVPTILDELNVKEVTFVDSGTGLYERSVRLDGKISKRKYKQHFVAVQEAVAALGESELDAALAAGGVDVNLAGETFQVEPEEVIAQNSAAEGWEISEGDGYFVALSTVLTDELRREGFVRDLVRKIQDLRKKIDLNVEDRISLTYSAEDSVAEAIEEYRGYIGQEVLAVSIERLESASDTEHVVKVGGKTVTVSIQKTSAE
jgi:isoleucyl-tRNA synthetase